MSTTATTRPCSSDWPHAVATAAAVSPATVPADAPAIARAALRLLDRMQHGQLELHLPGGGHLHLGQGAEPLAVLRLHNWSLFGAAAARGDVGVGETYIAGDWSTPDLAGLLRLFIHNRDQLESLVYGSWWGSLLSRLRHWRNRNTRAGSRRNIHAHYDLGNAFYARWLDETMNYSSAWFEGRLDGDLVRAQHAKVHRALREAGVPVGGPTDAASPAPRVLEIGCGWGALAEIATRDAGASVTGVTLSTEQLAWAQERLRRVGTSDRADLRLQDYRDIRDEPFDAVLSIEMFEAVGRSYWPSYFETVARCLKPGGRACIQSITIRDDLFESYARSTDFIQQYIFPGGLLPSETEFRRAAERAGLIVERSFAFGADYAETLRRWRQRFLAEQVSVQRLGFDERFARTWAFYLCYCEAAFDTGNTNVMQFTLRKPERV
ncbi:SAM-dependent methyltransferase [Sphaerotilus hippei]|nr:cyclopropane-fatty-acyl-phospholipid synthase family protein [Sphaerotilus hippei]